jgi:hypothetical protein
MARSILPRSSTVTASTVPAQRNLLLAVPGAFDERRFAPPAEAFDEYYRQVAQGYERMQGNRVVIAGLARDIEAILPTTIERVERLGGFFRDYRAVIYENDSCDRTRELLHDWSSSNPRVCVLSETRDDPVNLPSRCLSRATRMAYYRARCHEVVTREFSRFDHVILVDTDLQGGWSYDGVAHTFGTSGWDFVGANGIIYRRRWLSPNAVAHYDAWAYRIDGDFTSLTTKQVNRLKYHRGQPLQPVYSCFGGIGIYRMPAYLAGRYDGSDVEHVTFHREMHRRGFNQTYLNPNLIAVYGRKHRSLDRWAARVIRVLDHLPLRQPTVWQYAALQDTKTRRQPPGVVPRAA